MRPLVTVSYGGLDGDIPLTQFVGGSVLGRVNVEDAFVGLAGVHYWGLYFSLNTPFKLSFGDLKLVCQRSPSSYRTFQR